jgi:nucleotide-binding universal stress UspA family protein
MVPVALLQDHSKTRGTMNILVALDLSESSHKVVGQAKKMAKALSSKLWLLHVASQNPELMYAPMVADEISLPTDVEEIRDAIAQKFKNEHRQLQKFSQELRSEGIDCTAILVQGAITKTILSESEKLSADMVILGSQKKGVVDRFLLGSTSEGILHKITVPVLIVPTHSNT